ncbi:hypothetical protein ACFPM1_14935 [Halorubrum rubrum]|uniref:Protein NO VEIN C-terminal domain-containing protein n=1 Tax=Halorubrum rubrum TaxID=1126240 RepID=A0ABD5R547_9EURY|nr:hypothetical protein [Halorubrum rubrum]
MQIRSNGVEESDFNLSDVKVDSWRRRGTVDLDNDLLIVDLDFSNSSTDSASGNTVNSLWRIREGVDGFLRSDGTVIALVDKTFHLSGESYGDSYGIYTSNIFTELGIQLHPVNFREYGCQSVVENESLDGYLKIANTTSTYLKFEDHDFDEGTELVRRGEYGKPGGVAFRSIDGTGNGSLIILPRPHHIGARPQQWLKLLIESCLPYFPKHLQEEFTPEESTTKETQSSSSSGESQFSPSVYDRLTQLCERFPKVAEKLTNRYGDKEPLQMEDEHDVQDLFYALLKIDFDDIRAEEHSPSHAGSGSRVDFVLKEEDIGIEIKYAKEHTQEKRLKNQLAEDKEQYGQHPNCDELICFIYDPEHIISNPLGFEKDMTGRTHDLDTTVIISPK